ncbi:MAG: hypothetical protein CFK52_11480 [Chloracidobacterium sp. CP2_5A]|nr:MAG: hypothetical protein CFK52_11480 [Chloracidobacterium sp. CP2_5A]
MGFFDRFFGKKKEEPPPTSAPAYVPPDPPPLPTASPAPWSPPVESDPEPPPIAPPVATQPPASALVPETPSVDEAEEDAPEPSAGALTNEADFLMPGLAEPPGAADALAASSRMPADVASEAATAGLVEEVGLGVGARLEASPGRAGLDVSDPSADLDAADFDIPMAQSDRPEATGAAATDGTRLGLDDDDDLEGFDDAFESILSRGDSDDFEEDAAPAVATDQTEVRTLFSEIAANYIRPVKAFMIELRAGAARKEWLEMCQPAISSLGKSALGMSMEDVSDAVHDFEGLLSEARASREGLVGGELRERILHSYQTLTELLPATFVIDDSTLQSEGMIVNSLLKQIPEVGKVTIDKLYRAGLITIESFLVGAKEDLAVATGLPIWLAEKIVEKFKSYQQQLESGAVQSGRDGLLARLEQLTRDLQDAHEAYEIATTEESSNPSAAEDRRFYRQARQETQLQINVLLAELGAIELANEIQRLSFEKRIERLRRYVADERRS